MIHLFLLLVNHVEVFNHKVGLEEAALYLVLDLFADKDKLPSDDVKDYIESFKRIRDRRRLKKKRLRLLKRWYLMKRLVKKRKR